MLATQMECALLLVSTMVSVISLYLLYALDSFPAISSPQGPEQCRLQHRQPPRPHHYCQSRAKGLLTSRPRHQRQHLATMAKFSTGLMADNIPLAAHLTPAETVALLRWWTLRQATLRNVLMLATKSHSAAHGCGADPGARAKPEEHASSNRYLNRQFQEVPVWWLVYWLAVKNRAKCRLVPPALPLQTAVLLVVLLHPHSCQTLLHARK